MQQNETAQYVFIKKKKWICMTIDKINNHPINFVRQNRMVEIQSKDKSKGING